MITTDDISCTLQAPTMVVNGKAKTDFAISQAKKRELPPATFTAKFGSESYAGVRRLSGTR